MKIVSIVGARPQFIKHAPLSRELEKLHSCKLIHTGQHYDFNMNQVFFDELGIPKPDYNLGVGSGTHAYQTGEMMKGIEDILTKEQPSLVIIYGDTNSTLSGALATVKLHIKLAHVEAGLRIFDKSSPEEINRVVADYCSDYLFCPTKLAGDNLRQEGITKGVYITGDVMADALNFNIKLAERSNILETLGLNDKQYITLTLHRAGNTDNLQNLGNLVNALLKLGELGETIVFPIHPRTVKMFKSFDLFNKLKEKIILIEPLGYLDFLKLMKHSRKILTDSGGVQKEAYMLKVPCITLMEYTPWMETLKDGWNMLSGTDVNKIVAFVRNFMPTNWDSDIFGEGACKKIAHIIESE